jgi:hypothetical protein
LFFQQRDRFQRALEAAARYQRKVGVLGLSMTKKPAHRE